MFKQTPLIYAVEDGNETLAALLINWGARVNIQDAFGRTALIWAAEKGYITIVELLLKERADATLKNHGDRTARDIATYLAGFARDKQTLKLYRDIAHMLEHAETKQAKSAAQTTSIESKIS